MEVNEHEYKLLLIEKVIRNLIKEIEQSHQILDHFEEGTIAGYKDVLCLLDDDAKTLRERI